MIGRQAESSGDSSSPIPPSAMASRHSEEPGSWWTTSWSRWRPALLGRRSLKSGAAACLRLAMADGGIGDDESPDDSACLPIILAVGHVEPLKHDYSPNRRKSRCTP